MSKNSIDLTNILVEKNLIGLGTNISAKISVSAFGYAPVFKEKEGKVIGITSTGVKALFEDQEAHTKFENIMSVEGMELARFAQAYRIKVKSKKKS